MRRRLVAGVGHRFWRDLSAGPLWVDRLRAEPWPPGVDLEDYGFGALAMTQNLQDAGYGQVILLGSEQRGRAPGTLSVLRHESRAPDPEHVQDCLREAGSGAISLDLLLPIAGHFRALPESTWIVEVEPADTGWGDGLSPELESLFERVRAVLRELVDERVPAGAPAGMPAGMPAGKPARIEEPR